MIKNLGSGTYFPRVYDFFPKLARGHGAMERRERFRPDGTEYGPSAGPRSNPRCVVPTCELVSRSGRGEEHENQAQNRKDWEESVGLRRTSRANKGATSSMRAASAARLDPKDFQSLPATPKAD